MNSSAGGSEDQCDSAPPSRRRRSPPPTRARRRRAGPAARRRRGPGSGRTQSATTSAKRRGPPRHDLGDAADAGEREPVAVGLLPAEPAVAGAPRGERDRARVAVGDRDGDADQTAAAGIRGAVEQARRVSRVRGRCRRLAIRLRGASAMIATSPVRAISTSPCGRTMRSKASIFSAVPVISIVSVRRETSMIWPRKMSANCMISLRFSTAAETRNSAISRAIVCSGSMSRILITLTSLWSCFVTWSIG